MTKESKMSIKVLISNNASNSGMVLESQNLKKFKDQENMLPHSAEDMAREIRERRAERIMKEIMSKPQRGTKLFDMAGRFTEPFTSDGALPI